MARIKRFDYKLPGMRKPDNFIVYPESSPGVLHVQGDRADVRIDLESGKGSVRIGSKLHWMDIPMEFIMLALEHQPHVGDEIGPGVFVG